MTNDTIILIRVQTSRCELDFCEAGHYEDFPKVADFVSTVLDLEIDKRTDGPSERVWSFKNSTLALINDPYGTTLRASSWDDLPLLRKLLSQYIENKTKIAQKHGQSNSN